MSSSSIRPTSIDGGIDRYLKTAPSAGIRPLPLRLARGRMRTSDINSRRNASYPTVIEESKFGNATAVVRSQKCWIRFGPTAYDTMISFPSAPNPPPRACRCQKIVLYSIFVSSILWKARVKYHPFCKSSSPRHLELTRSPSFYSLDEMRRNSFISWAKEMVPNI
jgi:hypothetical protein